MDLFNQLTTSQAVVWATQLVPKYAALLAYRPTSRMLLITAMVYLFCMLASWRGGLLPKHSSLGWIMAQGWQGRERASGSPSRTRYPCTSPTLRCGSNHTYSNSILKPFLISFRNTCRQAVVIHKILWRFSCTARLVTDHHFALSSALRSCHFELFLILFWPYIVVGLPHSCSFPLFLFLPALRL
jgi:hypothetical protein